MLTAVMMIPGTVSIGKDLSDSIKKYVPDEKWADKRHSRNKATSQCGCPCSNP